jgi:alanine dehydrogenase
MTPSGVATLTAPRPLRSSSSKVPAAARRSPTRHYVKAGATHRRDEATRSGVEADMVVKVKEPIAPEFALMKKDLLLFTYLHLAAAQELGHEMLKRGVDGVAYETIEPTPGDLPLLTPMSAVAGRMAVQAGATYLERERGGKGVLLGGVPGVRRGRVTIIGAGVVGSNAAKIAVGLGANVTVLDVNLKTLAYLDDIYMGRSRPSTPTRWRSSAPCSRAIW